MLLYLLSCNVTYAQTIANAREATAKMKKEVSIKPFVTKDSLGGYFLKENNKLVEDENQYVITSSTGMVTIGMLVKNRANNQGQGDYSAYWRNSTRTANRYTWVFVLDDFKTRCAKKSINMGTFKTKEHLSDRLCQLLGLNVENENRRDTIVFVEVNKDDLFRPAYNTNVEVITSKSVQGENSQINALDLTTRRWFLNQQFGQDFPWTRMGYTYDWSDRSQNYVGVTEFILKPNSQLQNVKYHVIKDFLK